MRLHLFTLFVVIIAGCTSVDAGRRGGGGSGGSSGIDERICSEDTWDPLDSIIAANGSWVSGAGQTVNNDTSTSNTFNKSLDGLNNWYFDIYDAYFNGSFSLVFDPPSNQSQCPQVVSQVTPDAYLRIGQMSHDNRSRKAYDSNPYYFRLGRTFPNQSCSSMPNNMYFDFESSNDDLLQSQVWTAKAKKAPSGDAFELSAEITTTKANKHNYLNYDVFSKDFNGTNRSSSCPDGFYMRSMLMADGVSLTATVSPAGAQFSLTMSGSRARWEYWPVGWVARGSFKGVWWDKGARLITTGQELATEGAAERIEPDRRSLFDKTLKWVVIGVSLAIFFAVVYFVFRCCRCCGRKRQKLSA